MSAAKRNKKNYHQHITENESKRRKDLHAYRL